LEQNIGNLAAINDSVIAKHDSRILLLESKVDNMQFKPQINGKNLEIERNSSGKDANDGIE
jgi:hypothetical protein